METVLSTNEEIECQYICHEIFFMFLWSENILMTLICSAVSLKCGNNQTSSHPPAQHRERLKRQNNSRITSYFYSENSVLSLY